MLDLDCVKRLQDARLGNRQSVLYCMGTTSTSKVFGLPSSCVK